MTHPPSRSSWPPLVVAALIVPLVACDEVQLPVTVEEAPLFTSAAVNVLSAQPAHDSEIAAGSDVPFSLEVAFQRTPVDVSALPTADIDVLVGITDTDGLIGLSATFTEEVSAQRGTITLTGDLYVPTISPFCGTPAAAFTDTRIESTESFPRNDRFSRSDLEFDIAGGLQSVGECVYDVVNAAGSFTAANPGEVAPWGTPMYVGARHVTEDPTLNFPGTNFLIGVLRDPFVRDPRNPSFQAPGLADLGFSSFWTWVPPGATDGAVRAGTSQGEVVYGNDVPDQIQVPGGGVDFFEPNDEMAAAEWDFMDVVLDPIFGQDVLLFNPYLSLPDPDRNVDPGLNPDGFSGWGVGDWHLIIPTLDPDAGVTTQDVCVAIFFDSSDDLDLFLYDADGNLISVSAQSTGDSEFVGATTSTDLFVWVAPWMAEGEMNTALGLYQVEGADCAAFGTPAQRVAGSAEKLQVMDLPAGVSTSTTVRRPGSLLESSGFRLPSSMR